MTRFEKVIAYLNFGIVAYLIIISIISSSNGNTATASRLIGAVFQAVGISLLPALLMSFLIRKYKGIKKLEQRSKTIDQYTAFSIIYLLALIFSIYN